MVAEVAVFATSPELQYTDRSSQSGSGWSAASDEIQLEACAEPIRIPDDDCSYVSGGVDWIRFAMLSIRSLRTNWDGYGAAPISEGTIEQLEKILRHDLPEQMQPGSIVPGADGSLQAEWHLETTEMGIVVESDGSISSWVKARGGPEVERVGLQARELFWSVGQIALL